MIDKRRYHRTEAQPGDVVHPQFECKDISETGLKFKVANQQKVGSTFTTTLALLDEPIDVICKIVWCRKSHVFYDESYFIGIEFVGLPVLTQLQLRKIVNQRLDLLEALH